MLRQLLCCQWFWHSSSWTGLRGRKWEKRPGKILTYYRWAVSELTGSSLQRQFYQIYQIYQIYQFYQFYDWICLLREEPVRLTAHGLFIFSAAIHSFSHMKKTVSTDFRLTSFIYYITFVVLYQLCYICYVTFVVLILSLLSYYISCINFAVPYPLDP